MNKNVLIISSNHTGHGHKSITESLCERVAAQYADHRIHVVDGFELGGPLLLAIGKAYGPITRTAENVWKMVWNFSAEKPHWVNRFIELLIEDNLLKLLNEIRPDVILSVHPNFNGPVLNLLEKHQLHIPFLILIADLVNISPLWVDSRADYVLSPTDEAKRKSMEFGIRESRIKVLGFPVRSRFFRTTANPKLPYREGRPVHCLIMSGGEGVGNMNRIAEQLLDNFNCTVHIVAGRNAKMKAKLEEALSRYGDKVKIYGFIKHIQELMLASDVAFIRGSPNVMFEAIASNTPIIITGALPGQEQDNPTFAERANLGLVCRNPADIPRVMADLLANQGEKLNAIIGAQRDYVQARAARDILEFLLNVEKGDFEVRYAYSRNVLGKVSKKKRRGAYERL